MEEKPSHNEFEDSENNDEADRGATDEVLHDEFMVLRAGLLELGEREEVRKKADTIISRGDKNTSKGTAEALVLHIDDLYAQIREAIQLEGMIPPGEIAEELVALKEFLANKPDRMHHMIYLKSVDAARSLEEMQWRGTFSTARESFPELKNTLDVITSQGKELESVLARASEADPETDAALLSLAQTFEREAARTEDEQYRSIRSIYTALKKTAVLLRALIGAAHIKKRAHADPEGWE